MLTAPLVLALTPSAGFAIRKYQYDDVVYEEDANGKLIFTADGQLPRTGVFYTVVHLMSYTAGRSLAFRVPEGQSAEFCIREHMQRLAAGDFSMCINTRAEMQAAITADARAWLEGL